MNVGLRPRLRARPSLYDLIRNRRSIEQLSLHPRNSFSEELPPELPALPSSPFPTPPPTPGEVQQTELVEEPAKMPPKKAAARDEDGEEQYGMLMQIEQGEIQANNSS
jgi:hypothetical protein